MGFFSGNIFTKSSAKKKVTAQNFQKKFEELESTYHELNEAIKQAQHHISRLFGRGHGQSSGLSGRYSISPDDRSLSKARNAIADVLVLSEQIHIRIMNIEDFFSTSKRR